MSSPKVVVGLDFGTTFSGFAFSHRADPTDVHLSFKWPEAARPYCKTMSCLLYSLEEEDGPKLQAWGWEAFYKHSAAASKASYLATQFKLLLADPNGAAEADLPVGLTVERLIVDILRCICDFAIGELREAYGASISKQDVQWCLTVPAIWSEASKNKMRCYAEKAGLVQGKHSSCSELTVLPAIWSEASKNKMGLGLVQGNHSSYPLKIILEPEAASFHCQEQLRSGLRDGDKFIVADLGGGTLDVVVHQTVADDVLEVSASSGQLGGGTFIDKNFFDFLKRRIGCYEELVQENPAVHVRILEWWLGPNGKCSFDGTMPKVLEQLPRKLEKAWKKHNKDAGLEYQGSYSELVLSRDEMRSIFDTEIDKALQLIESKLEPDIKTVFLAGGLSESPYVVSVLKQRLETLSVLVPPNPGAAVCKGAVAIGFGTGKVLARISKKWYGMELAFGKFCTFVAKGESVSEDTCVTESFFPLCPFGERACLDLVACSSARAPSHVRGPGCETMASYELDINEDLHLGCRRQVNVSMYFGRSSIQVFAQRVNFGENRLPERLYAVDFE